MTGVHPFFVWLFFYAIDLLRYLIPASIAFLVFWVWGRRRFHGRLVQGTFSRADKIIHDVSWSMSTALIYSLFGLAIFYGRRAGVFRSYDRVAEHGIAWFGLSIAMLIVLQDTYFYWTHRAMHHRRLYKTFHRVHHRSTNPSPWTAYAFAVPEAIVHAVFVPLAWLVLPLHEAAVFVFMAFMIVRNVLGHLSIELYPSGFTKSRWWKWHTTTTHHSLHHRDFTSNFGLYFTYWDRWMGTLHRRYDEAFERVAAAHVEAPDHEVSETRAV